MRRLRSRACRMLSGAAWMMLRRGACRARGRCCCSQRAPPPTGATCCHSRRGPFWRGSRSSRWSSAMERWGQAGSVTARASGPAAGLCRHAAGRADAPADWHACRQTCRQICWLSRLPMATSPLHPHPPPPTPHTPTHPTPTPPIPATPLCPQDCVSPAWEMIPAARHLFLMLCNPLHSVTAFELPVYHPNEEEKRDPRLYAANVRKLMVRHAHPVADRDASFAPSPPPRSSTPALRPCPYDAAGLLGPAVHLCNLHRQDGLHAAAEAGVWAQLRRHCAWPLSQANARRPLLLQYRCLPVAAWAARAWCFWQCAGTAQEKCTHLSRNTVVSTANTSNFARTAVVCLFKS